MKNFKDYFAGVSTSLLVLAMASGVVAATQKNISVTSSDIKIKVNNTVITPKDANGEIIEPLNYNGNIYLPLRAVTSAIGVNIDWLEEEQTVILDTTKKAPVLNTSEEVIDYLISSNKFFQDAVKNTADISQSVRTDTAQNGQKPHTIVVTCSDSRVPPEHIFNAGIGELFVIRTAGNVIGDFELGSIEYGAEHLHAKSIVVLGHTNCGAVAAAIGGEADGNIQSIVDEILIGISDNKNPSECEILNVQHSIDKIRESEIIEHLEQNKKVKVVGAVYNISNGKVDFLE